MRHFCSILIATFYLFAITFANEMSQQAILVLGDSWGSFSGGDLKDVCSHGATNDEAYKVMTIANKSKSGSTAEEWATQDKVADSYKDQKNYDYVWLSVGGNDALGSYCVQSAFPDIVGNILQLIQDIVEESSNEDVKILFTGYGYPTMDLCMFGRTISTFDNLTAMIHEAIAASAYSSYVTLIDISDKFVTDNSSPYSDSEFYADPIHLNQNGYDRFYAFKEIQTFFGCSEEPYAGIPTSSPISFEVKDVTETTNSPSQILLWDFEDGGSNFPSVAPSNGVPTFETTGK